MSTIDINEVPSGAAAQSVRGGQGMKWATYKGLIVTCALAAVLAACSGQPAASPPELPGGASAPGVQAVPAAGDRVALFGDLHLHTSYSADAAAVMTDVTPDDAYRFAMGEPVSYLGKVVRRRAPLDFLAVTDHAEYLGNVKEAMTGRLGVLGDDLIALLDDRSVGEKMFARMSRAARGLQGIDTPGLTNPAMVHTHWQEEVAAAQRHYRPGRFTTLVAFEYSPTINSAHLHRNVIFRGPDYPAMPFGADNSLHPEALWAYAEANRARGIDSLMIPHNSNLSSGLAFRLEDSYGNPMTASYAEMRMRNEPLVEITQNKGTSETTPALSPNDEFADFELLPEGRGPGGGASSGNPDAQKGGFVRSGLMRGMQLAESLGINPFAYGFVGASDFHSGISASEEDNFPGGLGFSDPHSNPRQILQEKSFILGAPLSGLSASGLTGVWADSNTREAIFDALRRKETFATSGPRIRVRLFAGWSSPASFANGGNWAGQAYRWGVPMGGNLPARPAGSAVPNFIIQAARDPLSGNLDRVQIVKLWREGGQSHERIYNVAWSPGRSLLADGTLPPVGNTVDVAKASYANSIGAPELFTLWRDPDFDPSQRAIYYARAIEIPTPRWSTYLSAQTGISLAAGTKAWLQERAWTSPVYYTP